MPKFRVACRFLVVLWYALNSVLRVRIAQIAVQNITIIFLCLATSTNAIRRCSLSRYIYMWLNETKLTSVSALYHKLISVFSHYGWIVWIVECVCCICCVKVFVYGSCIICTTTIWWASRAYIVRTAYIEAKCFWHMYKISLYANAFR